MSIIGIQAQQTVGLVSVTPSIIYIDTSDTYSQVTATGYLTPQQKLGVSFNNRQIALVYTTDQGPVWLKVVITFAGTGVQNTVVSLVAPS